MRRLLLVAACLATVAAGDLPGSRVSGKVDFLTKRGQRPNLAETVVWAEPVGVKAPKLTITNSYEMVTRAKTLMPHVLMIPAGSTVAFPNQDPIAHNLFSLSPGNNFDLGFYRNGPGRARKFDAPGVVNVYCNVHPNMSAVIHVMPTPYYTFADATGAYSLTVPAGKYRLVAWNELGGMAESMI